MKRAQTFKTARLMLEAFALNQLGVTILDRFGQLTRSASMLERPSRRDAAPEKGRQECGR